MQEPATGPAMPRSRMRILFLILPLTILFLNACATMERPFRFHANSITKISYDPKNCTQMPDGKFKCKDVIFTVAAVEPAPK